MTGAGAAPAGADPAGRGIDGGGVSSKGGGAGKDTGSGDGGGVSSEGGGAGKDTGSGLPHLADAVCGRRLGPGPGGGGPAGNGTDGGGRSTTLEERAEGKDAGDLGGRFEVEGRGAGLLGRDIPIPGGAGPAVLLVPGGDPAGGRPAGAAAGAAAPNIMVPPRCGGEVRLVGGTGEASSCFAGLFASTTLPAAGPLTLLPAVSTAAAFTASASTTSTLAAGRGLTSEDRLTPAMLLSASSARFSAAISSIRDSLSTVRFSAVDTCSAKILSLMLIVSSISSIFCCSSLARCSMPNTSACLLWRRCCNSDSSAARPATSPFRCTFSILMRAFSPSISPPRMVAAIKLSCLAFSKSLTLRRSASSSSLTAATAFFCFSSAFIAALANSSLDSDSAACSELSSSLARATSAWVVRRRASHSAA
jgi:hypothetical protein